MTKIQELLNKVANGRELEECEINMLTKTGVSVRIDPDGFCRASTPYNSDFVNKMHQLNGARWDWESGTWNVPLECKDALTKAVADVYGSALPKSPVKVITVELKNKFDGKATKKSSIKFHGKALLFADAESGHSRVNENTTVVVNGLNELTESVSDRSGTYLVAEQGIMVRFMAYEHECDVKNLTESDELWNVSQVQEARLFTPKDKKTRKLKELEKLVAERNESLRKLKRLNLRLEDEFGVDVAFESVKRLYYCDAKRDFLKKWEAKEEVELHEKRRKEQEQRELEQKAEENAKKNTEKREKEALHTFYFTTDDVESATRKAIRIHLADDKSFWFPKALTREQFVYFKAIIPDDFDLTDTDDDEIDLKELHQVLGDKEQAQKHGEDNHLNCDLNVRHNRARGTHDVDLMVNIVAELKDSGMSDQWIMKNIGMSADELLRLKQVSGIAALFADKQFSKSWN